MRHPVHLALRLLIISTTHAAAGREGWNIMVAELQGGRSPWGAGPARAAPSEAVPAAVDRAGAGPILIVLHQEHSTPGRVGRLLRAMGHTLDIRRPRFGDALPDTMAEHAGAVIFGGPMSANDPDDWVKTEIDWVEIALRESAPLLGICLGAQMIARHLGQTVSPHPDGHVEVGYYPISPTEAGHRLLDEPFPSWVYHWHREGFCLPAGSTSLASGTDFECQAFRYGVNAFGLQFHPEVTYAMMSRWIVHGAARATAKNAKPLHGHRRDWFQHDAAVARWSGAFLAAWSRGDLASSGTVPLASGPACAVPGGMNPVGKARGPLVAAR